MMPWSSACARCTKTASLRQLASFPRARLAAMWCFSRVWPAPASWREGQAFARLHSRCCRTGPSTQIPRALAETLRCTAGARPRQRGSTARRRQRTMLSPGVAAHGRTPITSAPRQRRFSVGQGGETTAESSGQELPGWIAGMDQAGVCFDHLRADRASTLLSAPRSPGVAASPSRPCPSLSGVMHSRPSLEIL